MTEKVKCQVILDHSVTFELLPLWNDQEVPVEPVSLMIVCFAFALALIAIFGRVSLTVGGLPGRAQGSIRADLASGNRVTAEVHRAVEAKGVGARRRRSDGTAQVRTKSRVGIPQGSRLRLISRGTYQR